MYTFENTEIAFGYKSNSELKRAYWLFKAMSNPRLVKTGGNLAKFALRNGLPVGWAIKATIYKHFCGGETIEDSVSTINQLAKHNVQAVLDYSVEGSETEEGIRAALDETLNLVKFAGKHENVPFAVFKPTAFCPNRVLHKVDEAPDLSPDEIKETGKFKERVDLLCKTAWENNIPIMIDAEDSYYQDFIDETVNDMMEKYNKKKTIVYNTYQMYRWDRLDRLEKDFSRAVDKNYYMGAKFVRGAYMERERERAKEKGYKSPIHGNKEATDKDYNAALDFSVQHIDKISIFNGTHNEYSSWYLTELMKKKGIEKNDKRVYFSQLFGMSDHISFNLARAGYNVAKYLPYGPVKHVFPYLIRRTEENTSVKGQTSRELILLETEMKRRQKFK